MPTGAGGRAGSFAGVVMVAGLADLPEGAVAALSAPRRAGLAGAGVAGLAAGFAGLAVVLVAGFAAVVRPRVAGLAAGVAGAVPVALRAAARAFFTAGVIPGALVVLDMSGAPDHERWRVGGALARATEPVGAGPVGPLVCAHRVRA
ncbi:MAG: hypothetical protein ACRDZS_03510 [Acidimicrobiales bacterium]